MTCRSLPRILTVVCAVLLLAGVSLRAQDSVTLEFPQGSQEGPLPVGLAAWPVESTEGLTSLQIPLQRLNEEGALIVTVVFQDEDGRVIQAKWKGVDGVETLLSSNISEGVQGWNQRVLKVPSELLTDAGTIIFETDAEKLSIRRVNLSWTWLSQVFLGTDAQPVEVVQDRKRVLTKEDFADRVTGPVPDTWSKGIWRAVLHESKETLSEPLEFSFAMDGTPRAGILRVKLLGMPLDATADIWVNGHKVEAVSIEIPKLASEGYFKTADGRMGFAGWRDAAVNVPAEYLVAGENSIVFGGSAGAYIKDAYLELNFEDEGAPFAVGEPATAPVAEVPLATESPSLEPVSPEPATVWSEPLREGPAVISVP